MLRILLLFAAFAQALGAEDGLLRTESAAGARFSLGGEVGARVERNVDEWLVRAPNANPGMLEMFRVRDRSPAPQLVPWAGEFVGKYLISAIQALRMSERAELRAQVERVVRELVATQAGDGYLGPFPEKERLRGNWDLWGHYHCLEALALWHEETGDRPALTAARRAADLICDTFLDGKLRVHDAGSHEMNMAVITALGHLHRMTKEPRYLAMMREIEKDWERAGDYLRSGLDGREFYATPNPRWESLHNLQGLVELFRITKEAKYREAFEHHWRSIARNDIHNTGGFSSGEQATGNPYAGGAIETCCTVAWMALSVDMLRLTGDPWAAEFLELAFFNGGMGAQHPSGRWWTYNTPMDGVREASAHSIVFQARAGTPELNCCSVNAPRILGCLSEWAVMLEGNTVVLNTFVPGEYVIPLGKGKSMAFEISGNYPVGATAKITWKRGPAEGIRLKIRNPEWSRSTRITTKSGTVNMSRGHHEVDRAGRAGESISIQFDMGLRAVPGDREVAGKVSLYRGPILLAYDVALNRFDERMIQPVDLGRLGEAKLEVREGAKPMLAPWLELTLPTRGGQALRLCDFASAGARGTRHRSWLPVKEPLPPPVAARIPPDGSMVGKAGSWFHWTGPRKTNEAVAAYRLEIARADQPERALLRVEPIMGNRIKLAEPVFDQMEDGAQYTWRVTAISSRGETASVEPSARFQFRKDAPFAERPGLNFASSGPDGMIIDAPLAGSTAPVFGRFLRGNGAPTAGRKEAGGVVLNGGEMLVFGVEEFPTEEYSVAAWVKILEKPQGRLGQVMSGWAAGSDDPIRLVIDQGKLFARIESPGRGASTEGVEITMNEWRHVAAVKAGHVLTLFLDGRKRGETTAPAAFSTASREIALGGNPKYAGNEFLRAAFAEFKFYDRALSEPEIKKLAQ